MRKNRLLRSIIYKLCLLGWMLSCFALIKIDVNAVDFPSINVVFDPTDESVIVEGMPGNSDDGIVEYRLEGYMNYEGERVETFCYGPSAKPYDVPEKLAYIFNWADKEFVLPCSGDYQFTAYVTAHYGGAQGPVSEKGPKTTITITLNKKDESTNWGPGLPNTTVETYDLEQIKGKDKTIKIEEPEYQWTINGKDIVSIPEEKNLSLKITSNPDAFHNTGVDEFFGDTLALKLNIEHNGEFGFTAVLDYMIGAEYIGKYANLFYVVGDGTFEYMGADIVDETGMATFPFTHASDYVVAVTDIEYTGQELSPKVEEPQIEENQPPESKEPASEEFNEGKVEENIVEESMEVTEKTEPEVKENEEKETSTSSEENEKVMDETAENTASATAGATSTMKVWGIVGLSVLLVVVILILAKRKSNR